MKVPARWLGAASAALLLLPAAGSGADGRRRAAPSPSPEPPPVSSVRIANATSLPSIAVWVDGKPSYPDFPQGLQTAAPPRPRRAAELKAVDPVTGREASWRGTFAPGSYQTVLITGDFEVSEHPERLPGEARRGPESGGAPAPCVQFRLLPHALAKGEKPVRVRFVNAMPGLPMRLLGRQEFPETISPGGVAILSGEPPLARYRVEVAGREIDVRVIQEGKPANVTLVFFLERGLPRFFRIFEGTGD